MTPRFWQPGTTIQWVYEGTGRDRTVEWKDEDELEGAVATGRFSAEQAERIIADGHAAEKEVATWASPFADAWHEWQPNPTWRLPEAPTGYEVAHVAKELLS